MKYGDIEFNPGVNIQTDKIEEDTREVEIIEELNKKKNITITPEEIRLLMKNEFDYEKEKQNEIRKNIRIIEIFSLSIVSVFLVLSNYIISIYHKSLGIHYLFISIYYIFLSGILMFILKYDDEKRKIMYYILLSIGCGIFVYNSFKYIQYINSIIKLN